MANASATEILPIYPSITFMLRSFVSIHLILFYVLFRWLFFEIENVLLKPITGGHDHFSTLPPAPSPPSKTIPKCNDWRLAASTRSLLKIIALLRFTTLEESAIEMIV